MSGTLIIAQKATSKLRHSSKRMSLGWTRFWRSLTKGEKLYLTALISIPLLDDLVFASIITVIGLTIEFWPKFVAWWETLAGKAILLLFYGTITNFALADAGGYVNEVLKVSAESVNYTHNFSLLLIVPSWFLAITICTLLLFQAFMPFYLLLILGLKPFGIRFVRIFSKSNHPFMSNLIRTVLSFILIYQIFLAFEAISDDVNIGFIKDTQKLEEEIKAASGQLEQQIKDDTKQFESKIAGSTEPEAQKEVPSNTDAQISDEQMAWRATGLKTFINQTIKEQEKATENKGEEKLSFREKYNMLIKQGIANFAYYFEADEYSKCELEENHRAIELNFYEYLEVVKDKEAQYGFRFTVKKCISPAFK